MKLVDNNNPVEIIDSSIGGRESYSYLLGLYLGDGHISKMSRTYRIRFFLDMKYTNVNVYVKDALKSLFPKNTIGMMNRGGCLCIYTYNSHLPLLFPQMGEGRKHEREIKLTDWQMDIVDDASLLRGLIHSDGCFYKERVMNKYTYERFVFTNKSEDIQDIFQTSCRRIGVGFDTQIRKDGVINTRISKIADVGKMKNLVGIKD